MRVSVELARITDQVPVRDVMDKINESGLGMAVVVNGIGQVTATVTDGDIRRAILQNIDLNLPIRNLLNHRSYESNPQPIVAVQGTTSSELLRLMQENSVRQVPIVDNDGKLTDIVLINDLVEEPELPITAVVMAGGYGTRLRPLTEQLPKPMLPIGDRPLLELLIDQLKRSGIRNVSLTTHYKKQIISEHFGDGNDFGVNISYVEENEPLGTAGALSLLGEFDQPILVINGDILTKVDFRAMLAFHHEHDAVMTVAVRQHEFLIPYGVVEIEGSLVTSISEKPIVRHLINAGMYLLSPEVLKYIPSYAHYAMPELIKRLLDEGREVVSFPVEEYWLDIGRQADYAQAQEDAQKEGFQ